MIDKITAKIRKYPFQTGIIIGVVLCLLLSGFFSLFQDNGKTLAGNAEIIREDYLRMTINEYGAGFDDRLAGWRYAHLGRAGDKTLQLMTKDESIDPGLLVAFADAVGKRGVISDVEIKAEEPAATPAAPKKGISGFGKAVLIVLGLLVLSAAGLYGSTLIRTKKKQQKRTDFVPNFEDDPVSVITPEKARMTETNAPDTLFDLDKLFPHKDGDAEGEEEFTGLTDLKEPIEMPVDEDRDFGIDGDALTVKENKDLLDQIFVPEPEEDNTAEIEKLIGEVDEAEPVPAPGEETAAEPEEEPAEEAKPGLVIEDGVFDTGRDIDEAPEAEELPAEDEDTPAEEPEPETEPEDEPEDEPEEEPDPIDDAAEKPLVETDQETDANDEDEFLKMIRGSRDESGDTVKKSVPVIPEEPAAVTLPDLQEEEDEPEAEPEPEEPETPEPVITEPSDAGDEPDGESDVLIHYQSSYRVGNDMYDEVFSIDQGDVFRGECGIGIGETLNNTEPKAVTAFEIWLFDKDDIHTSTKYLVSDFGLNNEGILERLQQHGKCERIKNNGVYTLETETLEVEIRVLDLEYGSEMEEKSSYFTNVTFDVTARSKRNID